jgi:predicted enzyme related to lactoylglutathione lyase
LYVIVPGEPHRPPDARQIAPRLSALLLFVDDFRRALSFYSETLGLAVSGEESGEGYERLVDWVLLETGGAPLELFAAGVHAVDWGLPATRRNAAVPAFEVEDLDAAVAALSERGARFTTPVVERDWGRYAYLSDPEQNRIQLYEPRAAAAQKEGAGG